MASTQQIAMVDMVECCEPPPDCCSEDDVVVDTTASECSHDSVTICQPTRRHSVDNEVKKKCMKKIVWVIVFIISAAIITLILLNFCDSCDVYFDFGSVFY